MTVGVREVVGHIMTTKPVEASEIKAAFLHVESSYKIRVIEKKLLPYTCVCGCMCAFAALSRASACSLALFCTVFVVRGRCRRSVAGCCS